MKEIGGYLEFELRFEGKEYHKDATALNLARNALIYLARIKKYQKIYIPYFLCDCIRTALKENGIIYSYYHIDCDCRPIFEEQLADHEAILIVNYYGQLSKEEIGLYSKKWHGRIIIDNTHDFFMDRVPEVDMIYSPRKYFGIADGAYLYTDEMLPYELPQGYSYDRIRYLVGRYEKTANEFYEDFVNAEEFLNKETVKKMSAFSQNILRGIDYDRVRKRREENFLYLHHKLGGINQWRL